MKFKNLFLILSFALLTFFCACATPPVTAYDADCVKVTVADGEHHYLRKNSYAINRGDDLTVTVVFRDGYIPDGCSYGDYKYDKISFNEYTLTLYDIKYPEFVKIGAKNGNEAIKYFANGGEFTGERPLEGYIDGKISKTHLRTNTDLGLDIMRKGYIQTGWNTRPDGSGERVGLGSRITVNEEGATVLFAEWKEITAIENFEYELVIDRMVLTEYKGDKAVRELVLPEEIDGVPVIGIGAGFCDGVTAQSVVIPKPIRKVEDDAFINCTIENLYLFDTLSAIRDESFSNCDIAGVRINAASNPRFQTDTEISYFADAVDRLITLKDEKKAIFFSGCSFAYGLNSETVARELGEEFSVVNLGIIGGTNAGFQFDIISNFVGEGDVFIHAPEAASPFQLMADNRAELRTFIVTEGNYDLLSLVDVSKIQGFFTCFATYCKNRSQLLPDSYDGFSGVYNEFGDVIKPREFTGEDKAFTEDFSYSFRPDFVNQSSAEVLCGYYEKLRQKGVKVALSFSPINFHGLPPWDREARVWEKFENNVDKFLFEERGVEIISSVTDYIFAGRYFYDTDYHLNDEGVKIRTERLLRDMKAHGICGGKK